MSGSYSVQTDPRAKRTYHLAKFRDPVPALSDPSTTVKMTPNTGELGEQQWGLDVGGGRPFTGTRERVSGIGGKQSGYVLFRVEPSTGVLTVLPMSEWYDFKRSAVSIARPRLHLPRRPRLRPRRLHPPRRPYHHHRHVETKADRAWVPARPERRVGRGGPELGAAPGSAVSIPAWPGLPGEHGRLPRR